MDRKEKTRERLVDVISYCPFCGERIDLLREEERERGNAFNYCAFCGERMDLFRGGEA
jgi:hypothetical protein